MMTSRFAASWLVVIVLAAGVIAASATPVLAQAATPTAQAQPPAGGQGDFVPVKDLPAQETIPAAPLVMAAYAFVWAALLIYVWTVWRRLMKVEKEVKELTTRISERQGRS